MQPEDPRESLALCKAGVGSQVCPNAPVLGASSVLTQPALGKPGLSPWTFLTCQPPPAGKTLLTFHKGGPGQLRSLPKVIDC